MKEFTLENINPLDDANNKIWQTLNLLRGDIEAEEFYIILYLLVLFSEKIFPIIELDEDGESTISLPHIDVTEIQNEYQKARIETIYSLHDIFKEDLEKIRNNTWSELSTIFQNLDLTLIKENLDEIFEDQLYRIAKHQGRLGDVNLLPLEVSRFLCQLVELPVPASVYNPFAGLASFGVFLKKNNFYLGQEINQKTWAIGTLRLMAHFKDEFALFFEQDSLEDWGFKTSFQPDESNSLLNKFDLIISSPPFGARLPKEVNGHFGIIRGYEHFLIEKGIEELKSNGKLVALMPQSFLFRSGNLYDLRKHLIENDLLEMVISFPGGLLLETGIQICVIVINNCKDQKGMVRFIDAKKFVEQTSAKEKRLNDYALNSIIKKSAEHESIKVVNNETIETFDFNLNVARYFQTQYEGSPLGDLVAVIRGQRSLETAKGKFARIRDLKEDALDFQLSLSTVEDIELPRHAQKISESCLLVASRWKTLKPTYFNYSGTPLYISPDILALKIDDSQCDIVYLINELHAPYITEQLDSFRVGDVIPFIRKEDLLSIIISSLPNLNQQKERVRQKLLVLAEDKKRELNLFNKIHGLETEIQEQNTYLRHTIAGPSSNLKDSISNIKKILLDKIASVHPDLLNIKVDDDHLVTLGEYLNIVERDVTKIVLAVTSQLKVDTGIETKKLGPIDIISFLEKYAIEHNDRVDLAFRIDFGFDKEVFIDENGERIKTYILANEELLVDLFDNLIDNAVKHAFVPELVKRIEIFIMKGGENENKDEIDVLFSNTGKPFPGDFTFSDFVRKGSKVGPNAGDGFGGWYINEIIKKLNGKFAIIDQTDIQGLTDIDWATSFAFTFPIIEVEENV